MGSFLLWRTIFALGCFVMAKVLDSNRTTAQIAKPKSKPENVGQTPIKCQVPTALKLRCHLQIPSYVSEKKMEKLENEVS